MSIKVLAINHVCVVVKNFETSLKFYGETLGFSQHSKVNSWLRINDRFTLHLVTIPEVEKDDSINHELQHFALVEDLPSVLSTLLAHDLSPFQMDFEGNTHTLKAGDALTFGIGTIFVADPDGNLVEFLQSGHGIY